MTYAKARPRRWPQLGAMTLALALTACGAVATEEPASTPEAPASDSPSSAGSTADPSLLTVSASANIFGAGHELPPQPGGGGGGRPPVLVTLPDGASRTVAFADVSGRVIPVSTLGTSNGPEGTGRGTTDISSHGGISGILHQANQMFLVGVFLTDAEPADPAPERLDFTGNEDFETLEPAIAQVFLIGDGLGRTYVVPNDATRLFLGFADAAAFVGEPGYYGNNSGEVRVSVTAG